jgi:crossover junction endodeoxyribonuclease RuvC
MTCILGIDPGFMRTGVAVIMVDGKKIGVMEQGVLALGKKETLHERVAEFYVRIDQLITQHAVTCIALETPFLGKNAQNFLKLGYLRGIVYLLVAQRSLQLYEYAPMQVKKSVTGWGGASKEQVCEVLLRLFPALSAPKYLDASDALALALTAAWSL